MALVIGVAACGPTPPTASPTSAVPSPAQPTPPMPSATPQRTPAPTLPVHVRVPFADESLQAPQPDEVAVAGGAIWIERLVGSDFRLLRFDPVTARITASIRLEYGVGLLTADDGSLWAVGPWGYAPGPESLTVSRINLTTGRLKSVADVPVGGVAVGLGSIWVAAHERLLRLDRATGKQVKRWDLDVDDVEVACGAVWARSLYDAGLIRLDATTGAVDRYAGEGPVYERQGECWRRVEGGLERIWPAPRMTTPAPGSYTIWFEGSTFWYRTQGSMQRWDPAIGAGFGPTWTIDKQDISPYWKLGDDGVVLSAGGTVWLVNGFEIVGFDIPAD
jgi:hypothetical protein